VKKNLFDINLDNSSNVSGSNSLKTCEPCTSECEKINKKINGRKLKDINRELRYQILIFLFIIFRSAHNTLGGVIHLWRKIMSTF
jgi:hypothetical protein